MDLVLKQSSCLSDSRAKIVVLGDKNIDDICNLVRKPGGKNANGMPERGQQLSVIAWENQKLNASLFHQKWRCIFDWDVMGMWADTVCLFAGQKRIKNNYKAPDVLPKVNMTDMA